MTVDELLAAAILDAREAYALYESMRSDELLRLQIAHQLDQAHAVTPESIAFGGGRLALIAAVLRKRGVEETSRVKRCDHKFIDSTACLKCGWTPR